MYDKETLKNECGFCSSKISDISLQSSSLFSEITDTSFKESIPLPEGFPGGELILEVSGMKYRISGSATCKMNRDEAFIYKVNLERTFKKEIEYAELQEEMGRSYIQGKFK